MSEHSEKKQKQDTSEALNDLSGFVLEKALKVEKGTINLLGSFPGKPGRAVVLFARESLDESEIDTILQRCRLVREEQNTYYGFYNAKEDCTRKFKVTVIHPCQDWHIAKYTQQKIVLLRETPTIYREVTQPYIAKHPASEIKWLYQLLDKTAEQDRLLLETTGDTGFLMYAFKPKADVLKDDPKKFKAMVLCCRKDIKSIRDLTSESLPLLENIRDRVTSFVSSELKIPSNEIRLFFHYKPTYYHLHVHVVHVMHEMHVNLKDQLLDDVIEHLKMRDDYYAHKTLVYPIGVQDDLYRAVLEYNKTIDTN